MSDQVNNNSYIENSHQNVTILQDFQSGSEKYKTFKNKMIQLIENLLEKNEIKIESINGRVKTEKSLQEKLNRPGKIYSKLEEIPDIVGLRILVYHPEEVDRVTQIIREKFEVDDEESGDAAERLAPHEFGYLSVHIIIRLPGNLRTLTEWITLETLHAEVQIRTVLQHAWASISHALQYKHENEFPSALRRRLYRLSALLELADQEFDTLNREHKDLFSSPDREAANILMILRKALGRSQHSYDWIRSHTPLTLTNDQFNRFITDNPKIIKKVRVLQRSQDRKRIIPGKPGLRFIDT